MSAKRSDPRPQERLQSENESLRRRLEEAEEALRAIREGEVDAIVVSGSGGERVFSLTGVESIYRQIVETMKEAALTVGFDGTVLFANSRLSELLGRPMEQIVGHSIREFASPDYGVAVESLLVIGRQQPVKQRLVFQNADGKAVPVHVSAHMLVQPEGESLCVVAADLTELENSAELVQQLRRHQEELRAAHSRIQDILERMGDGFVTFDRQWRYTYVNPAAAEAFHMKPEQLLGRNLWELWPAAYDLPIGAAFRRSLEENIPIQFEICYPDPLNEWFECRCYPMPDGLAAFFTIVTERKRAEEALHRAKDELEERVLERTAELQGRAAQLARLASELTMAEQRERGRLALVLHDGLQQTLVAAKFRLKALEAAGDKGVWREAAQLGELLSDAIGTSRSLATELSPPVLKIGLAPALEWLARWMQEKHGLAVVLDVPAEIDSVAEDVTIMLFQAVRELLFNVVKHAGVKTARVSASRRNCEIVVSVEDQGRGFNLQDVLARHDRRGGLGLFAIRERVELLGGRVSIESAPGRGSHLTLAVPAAPETAAGAQHETLRAEVSVGFVSPSASPDSSDAEGRLRVVLVDDHAVVRQGLATLLRQEPLFQVAGEASDGRSAVELVRRLRPDVVLMDVGMPGMDGIEATKIIHNEFPDVCVIGLTMHDDSHVGEKMREAGASAFLSKSDPADNIVKAILSCLGQGRGSE
jgi:PAS domain S-box-containing protein